MNAVYSVTQLNNEIKELLEAVPGYRNLFVRGEISNYKAHSSGHHYMSLKDENAAINAVMFRSDAAKLKFRIQNGMKVIVRARVGSFPKTGQVQLYIYEIVPEGEGALSLAFEQLKRKLMDEGLFDERHKKPIPKCPENVALVTSETGAAVRDMIRILGRRWPMAKVVLYPAQVQGSGAAESIARALALANAVGESDVILCGRGGGSMEDLWAFNEEVVARAIYASEIPVISAVGHEPDVTIADFVADLRAPTPSGAAELAVPDRLESVAAVKQFEAGMYLNFQRRCARERERLNVLEERLKLRTPLRYIEEKRLLLGSLDERRYNALSHGLQTYRRQMESRQQALKAVGENLTKAKRLKFARLAATLDAVSPLRVLARGYAVATRKNGETVTDAASLRTGESLNVRFSKGGAECSVTEIREEV